MTVHEVNFDGLVGPTHNYAGLAYGNIASGRNVQTPSNPREAARQGLAKMQALMALGLKQAVLPPQERPAMGVLRQLGFGGSDREVLARAAREAPRVLAACCSASSMWTANAATVSPGVDAGDGRVHFTPANLVGNFHRSLEPPTTTAILRAIFHDPRHFAVHEPLPAVEQFGDEGAANHTRLCAGHGTAGVEFFVYGREGFDSGDRPGRYPARQTREASEAIARRHGLLPERVVYARQNPTAIAAGVFHNDVIAVGNGPVLLFHELAFADTPTTLTELQRAAGELSLQFIQVREREVSLNDAVNAYLFNSQLLTLPDGEMALILPEECRSTPSVWEFLQALVAGDNPVTTLRVFDLKQSMRNGGGPACLRLRVVLTDTQLAAMNHAVLLDDSLLTILNAWVDRHYRDRLTLADLADPALLEESRAALDELTRILGLGSVYPFQKL